MENIEKQTDLGSEEPLEDGDADNASSFADFNNRTKVGDHAVLPEGLANTIAQIARDCLMGISFSLGALEKSLVQRLKKAALCVKKAVTALGKEPGSLAEKVKSQKNNDRSI